MPWATAFTPRCEEASRKLRNNTTHQTLTKWWQDTLIKLFPNSERSILDGLTLMHAEISRQSPKIDVVHQQKTQVGIHKVVMDVIEPLNLQGNQRVNLLKELDGAAQKDLNHLQRDINTLNQLKLEDLALSLAKLTPEIIGCGSLGVLEKLQGGAQTALTLIEEHLHKLQIKVHVSQLQGNTRCLLGETSCYWKDNLGFLKQKLLEDNPNSPFMHLYTWEHTHKFRELGHWWVNRKGTDTLQAFIKDGCTEVFVDVLVPTPSEADFVLAVVDDGENENGIVLKLFNYLPKSKAPTVWDSVVQEVGRMPSSPSVMTIKSFKPVHDFTPDKTCLIKDMPFGSFDTEFHVQIKPCS